VIVVLGGIFVIGDLFARSYAQNMVASKAQSYGFPAKPSVSIKGFPFLTQVAARDINEVDLSASNTAFNNVRVSSVKAVASGVRINSSYNGGTADTVAGTVVIPFASLLSAMGAPSGITVSADPSAGSNVVKIGIGPVNTDADVTRAGPSTISLRLQSVGGIPLSAAGIQSAYALSMPHLPFGLALSGVSVTSQGVSGQFTAHNVTLSQSGTGS
jgi:hypothetical protein